MPRLNDLRRMCAHWQRRLRLQDWRVTVELSTMKQLGRGRVADVTWSLESKSARIRVAADADGEDHQKSVVHELLHLHLAPLGVRDGTAADVAQEIAIELIAGALCES